MEWNGKGIDGLRIRRYGKGDKKGAEELIVDAWGRKWLPGNMHVFEKFDGYVAELDGRVVGGVGLDCGTYACLIDFIIVHSKYRRRGVGKALLGFAMMYARERHQKIIKGFVDIKGNRPVLKIWKKYGFRESGELRNLYAPDDHYVYIYRKL